MRNHKIQSTWVGGREGKWKHFFHIIRFLSKNFHRIINHFPFLKKNYALTYHRQIFHLLFFVQRSLPFCTHLTLYQGIYQHKRIKVKWIKITHTHTASRCFQSQLEFSLLLEAGGGNAFLSFQFNVWVSSPLTFPHHSLLFIHQFFFLFDD